ncbi:response regulator [Terracoccus luteus]|jgi:DNA-binding NarL/FixJ family response regulator|uniref:DNA-binding NarL/FixJ family response regulator n=1 Tax=Terracoccus luteus TaxID=53356 RepID=A0A495Y175_9MICO|nr:response regulator transcription factor [Terracoccus luteus]MBB2987555.1 DNA-binding NarL/FixJ family response regulator [Terracoccus luteus]MCP2173206.1 DNA-binding NarL/FixJ family response regulator [Terracoccus luteus]RKT79952.1 LuxR family two component transcriptional regulator [Terracoccus luteus]
MSEAAGGSVTRIVLVDDDALVRAGLRLILGGAPDLEVVAEAGDGVEAIEVVARERPDVVLMDIRMPRRDGLEATRMLLQGDRAAGAGRPGLRVIVLTTFDADEMVVQALRSGAHGFLLKDTEPRRLVEAVRAVARGEPMLSPSVTATLMSHVASGETDGEALRRAEAVSRLECLTDREREVALAIGRGLSNAEISRDLFLSVPTVKAHVSRVLAKLEAENRVQVAIAVHDAGLS